MVEKTCFNITLYLDCLTCLGLISDLYNVLMNLFKWLILCLRRLLFYST